MASQKPSLKWRPCLSLSDSGIIALYRPPSGSLREKDLKKVLNGNIKNKTLNAFKMLLTAHGIKMQTVVSCFELCAISIHFLCQDNETE